MPTFVFDDERYHWQMARWEKFTLSMLLQALSPQAALEVGTLRGGSLQAISRFAKRVFSIDVDPECVRHCAPDFKNVTFITGDSKQELPRLLEYLANEDDNLEFVLIDGDHSADGVAADINLILQYTPRTPLHILIHDSFNPECRKGIRQARWSACEFVHYVELDFVPGTFHELEWDMAMPRTMWGGFTHGLMLPERRCSALTIHESQKGMFELVYPESAHYRREVAEAL